MLAFCRPTRLLIIFRQNLRVSAGPSIGTPAEAITTVSGGSQRLRPCYVVRVDEAVSPWLVRGLRVLGGGENGRAAIASNPARGEDASTTFGSATNSKTARKAVTATVLLLRN